MAFNDDEQSAPVANNNGGPTTRPPGITGVPVGQVQLTKYHNAEAPLDPNDQEVLLELKGTSSATSRAALDLIAVLDVSTSMAGDKLDRMKAALLFVIRKLADVDRLSIVTFSNDAARLCPLRFVAGDAARADLKALQNRGDATRLDPGGVPVHTFGLGADHDPAVLQAIAGKSREGMFHYVADGVNLTAPFSQLLGGLLTIIAQDLELTVTRVKGEAAIKKVDAGTYPQAAAADGSSVTVQFGTLYSAEVRRVLVYLALEDSTAFPPYDAEVVEALFRYSLHGATVASNPDPVSIRRSGSAPEPSEEAPARKPEVETEMARRRHAESIREVRSMADGKELERARTRLVEAQNKLEDVLDQANPMVDMLREELLQLLRLMETQEAYERAGRAYAVSSLASHDRQRFAARVDAEGVRLFATPRMDAYLEQARRFDEDPGGAALPSAEEDVRQEVAANPLAPVAGQIAFYVMSAIQALQAIDKIFASVAAATSTST
uniref:VWFA domain-containing protein n=1 Tax=Oryza glumipatula TaxID=40148 RepID=A0A0D9Z8N8_9ORYZ